MKKVFARENLCINCRLFLFPKETRTAKLTGGLVI